MLTIVQLNTDVAGKLGQHGNDSVVGDDRQVLLVTGDTRHSSTDTSQHVDTVRLEETYYQLETTHEATYHLTRVLYKYSTTTIPMYYESGNGTDVVESESESTWFESESKSESKSSRFESKSESESKHLDQTECQKVVIHNLCV